MPAFLPWFFVVILCYFAFLRGIKNNPGHLSNSAFFLKNEQLHIFLDIFKDWNNWLDFHVLLLVKYLSDEIIQKAFEII